MRVTGSVIFIVQFFLFIVQLLSMGAMEMRWPFLAASSRKYGVDRATEYRGNRRVYRTYVGRYANQYLLGTNRR